jgi:hypothetical protein
MLAKAKSFGQLVDGQEKKKKGAAAGPLALWSRH